MHLLQALHQLLAGHQAPAHQSGNQPVVQAQPPQDPGFPLQGTGARPDITFNPNPNTNIPFSSHDPRVVQQMARQPFFPQMQGSGSGFPMMNQGQPLPMNNPMFAAPHIGINPADFRATNIQVGNQMHIMPQPQPMRPIKGYGVNGNEFVSNGI